MRTRARQTAWDKTGGWCAYCGCTLYSDKPDAARIGRGMVIDHGNPRARGGADDAENFYPACAPCNSYKGVRTVDEFRLRVSCDLGLQVTFQIDDTRAQRDMLFMSSSVRFRNELVEHNFPGSPSTGPRPRKKKVRWIPKDAESASAAFAKRYLGNVSVASASQSNQNDQ